MKAKNTSGILLLILLGIGIFPLQCHTSTKVNEVPLESIDRVRSSLLDKLPLTDHTIDITSNFVGLAHKSSSSSDEDKSKDSSDSSDFIDNLYDSDDDNDNDEDQDEDKEDKNEGLGSNNNNENKVKKISLADSKQKALSQSASISLDKSYSHSHTVFEDLSAEKTRMRGENLDNLKKAIEDCKGLIDNQLGIRDALRQRFSELREELYKMKFTFNNLGIHDPIKCEKLRVDSCQKFGASTGVCDMICLDRKTGEQNCPTLQMLYDDHPECKETCTAAEKKRSECLPNYQTRDQKSEYGEPLLKPCAECRVPSIKKAEDCASYGKKTSEIAEFQARLKQLKNDKENSGAKCNLDTKCYLQEGIEGDICKDLDITLNRLGEKANKMVIEQFDLFCPTRGYKGDEDKTQTPVECDEQGTNRCVGDKPSKTRLWDETNWLLNDAGLFDQNPDKSKDMIVKLLNIELEEIEDLKKQIPPLDERIKEYDVKIDEKNHNIQLFNGKKIDAGKALDDNKVMEYDVLIGKEEAMINELAVQKARFVKAKTKLENSIKKHTNEVQKNSKRAQELAKKSEINQAGQKLEKIHQKAEEVLKLPPKTTK